MRLRVETASVWVTGGAGLVWVLLRLRCCTMRPALSALFGLVLIIASTLCRSQGAAALQLSWSVISSKLVLEVVTGRLLSNCGEVACSCGKFDPTSLATCLDCCCYPSTGAVFWTDQANSCLFCLQLRQVLSSYSTLRQLSLLALPKAEGSGLLPRDTSNDCTLTGSSQVTHWSFCLQPIRVCDTLSISDLSAGCGSTSPIDVLTLSWLLGTLPRVLTSVLSRPTALTSLLAEGQLSLGWGREEAVVAADSSLASTGPALSAASRLRRSAMFSYWRGLQNSMLSNDAWLQQQSGPRVQMSGKFDDEISYATHKKHSAKFKLVFIGDQAVGKSSIISRFIKNEFDSTHNPTVGIDFVSKNVQLADKSVRLQLWDTAGQERFRSLIPGYLRDSHGIFVVYDVTSEESYSNLHVWLDYVKEYRGQDVLIFLVGNKIDEPEQRTVPFDDVKERFGKSGALFMEVSAKTGENLEALFTGACHELMKSMGEPTAASDNTHSQLNVPRKRGESRVGAVTGEKERPVKKESTVQEGTKSGAGKQTEARGTKLENQVKKGDGTVVREKNCC